MDHWLTCSCGKQHTVSRSQAGQAISCECGNEVQIPTLRGFAELPIVEGADSPTTATRVAKSNWAGWRAPTMAALTGICLIAGISCLYFSLQRLAINTSYTEVDEIRVGAEAIDLHGADALSLVWDDYESYGLGRKQRPPFYIWNNYARERLILASISGGITAFFGLLAAGVWLSARKSGQ